ncbi:hypothetical protein ABIE48_005600 [Paenibacillus sp. OAE614]
MMWQLRLGAAFSICSRGLFLYSGPRFFLHPGHFQLQQIQVHGFLAS